MQEPEKILSWLIPKMDW